MSLTSTDIYRINPDTGAYTVWASSVVAQGRALVCHPDGRVFVASNPAPTGDDVTVTCLDSSGSVLWSTTLTSVGLAYDLAVTNDDHVYLCTTFLPGGISGVYKLDATTGTQIVSGWPYQVGAPGSVLYYSMCADQSGNVYVGGFTSPITVRALSLDSSGGLRWTSLVSNTTPDTQNGVFGIAVNATGAQVHCVRSTSTTVQLPVAELYTLNSSTGAVTGQFSLANNSRGSAQGGNSAAYDTAGDYFSGVELGNNPSIDRQLYKNGSSFMQFGNVTAMCLAAGPDGDIFVGGRFGTAPYDKNVFSVDRGWAADVLSASHTIRALDVSTGRIGAFGL